MYLSHSLSTAAYVVTDVTGYGAPRPGEARCGELWHGRVRKGEARQGKYSCRERGNRVKFGNRRDCKYLSGTATNAFAVLTYLQSRQHTSTTFKAEKTQETCRRIFAACAAAAMF